MIKGYSRMRLAAAMTILLALAPGWAAAFDYFLLSLSWSPSWCAATGDADAEQCAPERDLGFVLHGLWPQFEDGWPEYCDSRERDPSRRETAAMADVMGSGGLAWHTWKKHGRCAEVDAATYFAQSRLAFGLVRAPDLDVRMPAEAIEAAFLRANPGIAAQDLIVTCRDGRLNEVRLCLTRDLEPRACGADVARATCRTRGALELPDAP
jgi:ribonuclease T2